MGEKIAESILQQYGLPVLLLLGLLSILATIVRESRKLREQVSYQVSRDLLERRFVAYGKLWSSMGPVAIYGEGKFEPGDVGALRQSLATWYFSAEGGLYLTKRARAFYFALQKMLARTSALSGWTCQTRPDEPERVFRDILRQVDNGSKIVDRLEYLDDARRLDARDWAACCGAVTEQLCALVESKSERAGEAIFASIQQASSALRTILASDVRSRLDVKLPGR